jgi:Uma2 family endonuclease
MGIPNKKFISEKEYLKAERLATEKHEYFQGEIFAMSGASDAHNVISVNCTADLRFKLKGKKCRPYGSDMRMNIPENTLYTYPDLSVYCGDLETLDTNFDTAKKPTVIFEILSKSTRNYDQGEKFALYRQIPTLKEYILIDSEKVKVIQHIKTDVLSWNFTEYISINDKFEIKCLELEMKLLDIYEDVELIK